MVEKNRKAKKSRTSKENKKGENLEKPVLEETAMIEYLTIMHLEYSAEREKKNNFDTRAGIMLAFQGALMVFLLDNDFLIDSFSKLKWPLIFFPTVKFILEVFTIISCLISIFYLMKVMGIKEQASYPITKVDVKKIKIERTTAICHMIMDYKNVVIAYRNNNEDRASNLKKSMRCVVAITISLMLSYIIK